MCTWYYTERECLFNVDDDPNYRCHWEYLEDDYDGNWAKEEEMNVRMKRCCFVSGSGRYQLI